MSPRLPRLAGGPRALPTSSRPRPEAIPLLEEAADHAASSTSGTPLGFGVANARGQYAEWAGGRSRRLGTPGWPASGRRTCTTSTSCSVLGPTPADEALETLDALMPEGSHPILLAAHAPISRDARPLRRGVADREGGERATARAHRRRRGRNYTLAEIATLRRRLRGRSPPPPDVLRLPRGARAARDAVDLAPMLRTRRSARSDATTRPSPRRSSAASSGRSTTSRPRRSGDRGGGLDLAEVLAAARQVQEAIATLGEALERYERKRCVAAASLLVERRSRLMQDVEHAGGATPVGTCGGSFRSRHRDLETRQGCKLFEGSNPSPSVDVGETQVSPRASSFRKKAVRHRLRWAASERCPSGLRSATGNRVRGESCVAGSNPALSVLKRGARPGALFAYEPFAYRHRRDVGRDVRDLLLARAAP